MRTSFWQNFLTAAVVVFHVVGQWSFLVLVRGIPYDIGYSLLIAIPPAQVTLTASWAILSHGPAIIRFPLSMGGVAVLWLLVVLALGIDDDLAAAWLVMFIVQWTVVAVSIVLGAVASRPLQMRIGIVPEQQQGTPLRLRDIFLWTACLAGLLWFLRTVVSQLELAQEDLVNERVRVAGIAGVICGLVSVAMLGWLALPRWLHIAIGFPIVATLLGGLFWAEAILLDKASDWPDWAISDWLIFSLIQSGIVLVTLILLRVSGRIGQRPSASPVSQQ